MKPKFLILTLSVVVATLTGTVAGSESGRFYNLTTENGLAHTDATCILEDKDGFIWIGTFGGLQCYDGYELSTYDYYCNSKSPIRQFHNRITTIAEQGDLLWIGTKSGITCFDLSTRRYVDLKADSGQGLTTDNTVAIKVLPNGMLWVQTANTVYMCGFDSVAGQIEVVQKFNSEIGGLKINLTTEIIPFEHGVWVINNSKIGQISVKGTQITIGIITDLRTVTQTHEDNQQCTSFYNGAKLYIRTPNAILSMPADYSSGQIDFTSTSTLLLQNNVPELNNTQGKIAVDSRGVVWCNSQIGVIKINDPFSSASYNVYKRSEYDQYSLTTNFVSGLYIDNSDNIWVTTWGGGVNFARTDNSQFNLITHNPDDPKSITGRFVKAIEGDNDGTLWIVTQNFGVNHYDFRRGVIARYPLPPEIDGGRAAKSIKISLNGRYIFVGAMDGMYVIDKKTKQSKVLIGKSSTALINKAIHVYCMELDSQGNLWVGTWNDGIFAINYDNGQARLLHHITSSSGDKSLSSNLVSFIMYRDNQIFACTDAGINRIMLDGKSQIVKIAYYGVEKDNPYSLSNNFVAAITAQSDTVYWIGTLGGGLNRMVISEGFDQGNRGRYRCEVFTKNNGLRSNDIEIVLLDNDNNVWFGGMGITKLEYPSRKLSFFDFNDGLQSNSFKIGSSYKDKKGIIYFGGINGLNYFDPTKIKQSTKQGHLVFTSFMVHNNQIFAQEKFNNKVLLQHFINQTQKIKLKHDQNDFTIEFSALNYFPSDKVSYRFRLANFNNNWVYVSNKTNRASFSNLDYGTYQFEVQASYDSGATWDPKRRIIEISVVPPWWWSFWSKLIYLLLILGVGIVIIYQYIHQIRMRHELEIKNIEENQREENHQMKLQFFMHISHEFRTPLTFIISSIECLLMPDTTETQQRGFIDIISRNANKLRTLITQLMDFRKTDIGADRIRTTYGEIVPYVNGIVREFEPLANKKNIMLYLSNNDDICGVGMWFDREKVTKILWNLVSNALRYTEPNGSVEVSVTRNVYREVETRYKANVRFEANPNMELCCLITVHDTGVGITEESLPKIFERFFQVVSKTSLHLGSGIGLAVAKNMALSHKGNIIVSSSREVGTEFIVALPLDESYYPDDERFERSDFDVDEFVENEYVDIDYEVGIDTDSVSDDNTDSNRASILIVEDNIELQMLLQRYLEKRYDVLTATNGKQGLDICMERYPDLVISDVMMPEMNGMEMCQEIKENLSTSHIPVILLTAKTEINDQIDGLESGADVYLSKPFVLRILDLHIRRLLSYKEKALKNPFSMEKITLREDIVEIKEKEFVEKLISIMKENLDNSDYSINNLCRELGVGRTKLYTRVKDLTGQSLGDLIREIRLTRAAELLVGSDKNITEIIYDTGFGSNSHFSKAFKTKYGITPSEYAKNGGKVR